MITNHQRFDRDWYAIPKRYIYTAVAVVILSVTGLSASLYLWRHGNPFGSQMVETQAPAGAKFVSFDGDVRVVRAATRETIQARGDTQLYPGDIVQTQGDSRARILLVDGSTLIVRPNSVVTIRDNTSAADGGRTRVRVAVDRGQINVRTESQAEGMSNVVETMLTENQLTGQTGASFGVHEDHTEDIRVSTGQIEMSTSGGEKTTVRGGEYLAINQSGNVARRERLLDVPMPTGPANLEKISVGGNGAASVALNWQHPASGVVAHYRVEVATSPFFVQAGKVMERDQIPATRFDAGDLRGGVYFWRVRAVAASGQTSEWSEPQKFIVAAAGGTGEAVTMRNLSVEYVAGNIYLVRGRSQPGNTVRVGERSTLADSTGAFQLQITAPKGTREIIVEAEDTQGNHNRQHLPLAPGA